MREGMINMVIKSVTDKEFKKYGQVLKNYDCSEIIENKYTCI
jgi:ureidoglycolate hydrolase